MPALLNDTLTDGMQLNAAARATTKFFTRLPPLNFSQATHRSRSLAQLRSKNNGLEKYIFLNGLKERDPALFYNILYDNMRVSVSTSVLLSANT